MSRPSLCAFGADGDGPLRSCAGFNCLRPLFAFSGTIKFAVNIFLIASITGLAEAAHFAQAEGLDLQAWADIVNASQMASDISRVKVDKLLADNFDAQSAISNVLETTRLIAEAAQADGICAPLMDASLALYRRPAPSRWGWAGRT